jgi:hypothetical protein
MYKAIEMTRQSQGWAFEGAGGVDPHNEATALNDLSRGRQTKGRIACIPE